MLRTGQLPPPRGARRSASTPASRPTPGASYQGPWRLPGPDSHRLAALSLSLGYVTTTSLSSWRPNSWTHSKTDAERLLVVSPDLAHVLSTIICRVRGAGGAIPSVSAYDRLLNAPGHSLPRCCSNVASDIEHRAISTPAIRDMLTTAAGPHRADRPRNRRAVALHPARLHQAVHHRRGDERAAPHIAQVIAGHRDINVTIGYKAVYPERPSRPTWRSWPGDAPTAQRRIPRPHRRGMERVPRPLRTTQGLHRHLRPRILHRPASTNTPASAARCSGPTRPPATASSRSATTSPPASPKPNAKAGSAKSKDCESASPARRRSSTRSTAPAPARPSISTSPSAGGPAPTPNAANWPT